MQSSESIRYPTWVRWETEFKRKNGVTLDYRMLHPDHWLSFALGASHKLSEIFGQSGLRGVWLKPKGRQEVIERAGRAGLSLYKQRGVSNYYLLHLYGLDAFLEHFCRPDEDSPLASLIPGDIPAINDFMWKLDKLEEAVSPHLEDYEKLAVRMGIDSAPLGVLRSIAQGDESDRDVLF
jgi:hypothetical protein